MIRRISTVFVCGALLLVGVVQAQERPARVTDAQLQTVDASMRVQIRAIGDSAVAAGISADPILQIGRQGSTKHLPARTVIAAASRFLRDMRTAQTALGAGASSEDIKTGAYALQAGVDVAALGAIAAEKRDGALYVSLSVLTDLVTSTVPVDTAVRMVTRLVVAGARDAELTAYRDVVRGDIALGRLPAAAASLRAEAVRAGIDVSATGLGARRTGGPPIPPSQN
jgi:hypothetical protein